MESLVDGMAGLQALCSACQHEYPEQPNPLQVTARLKYWLGGPDPLDYISMYWNSGQPERQISPHWHYISFGLSDLHGDGRVHPRGADGVSGFGLELTMRVAGSQLAPPTWPAALLQRLARYVFATGNRLRAADHVSWHGALDGGPAGALRHMLLAADARLAPLATPLGSVEYVQVVGITDSELRSAQRCGGAPLLAALAAHPGCGPWLVTDMKRSQSVEPPEPPSGPSDLSGVAAQCRWEPLPTVCLLPLISETNSSELPQTVKEQIKHVLLRGLSDIESRSSSTPPASADTCKMSVEAVKVVGDSLNQVHLNVSGSGLPSETEKDIAMSTDSFKMTEMENALLEEVMKKPAKTVSRRTEEEWEVLEGVHFMLDKEAASMLPLALRGRVLHGAHFTWSAAGGAQAVTLLGAGVRGAQASPARPRAARGGWLQLFLAERDACDMTARLAELESSPEPATFLWPELGLRISVLDALPHGVARALD